MKYLLIIIKVNRKDVIMKSCKIILLFVLVGVMVSCEKEDDYTPKKTTTTTKTIKKPEVKITSHFASGSYDGWYVIGTVTTGGDDPENVECYVEWSKFAKKQSGNVTLSNKDKMRITNYSSIRLQFKKEHAGINKGNYIYYRLVGSNSKYSTTTSTTYMVAQ